MPRPCPHDQSRDELFESIDPLSAEVFRAFKRLMHLNRQYMLRATAEKGGHPAQVGCLMVLKHEEGLTQRDLAERLHIAPATLTTMLQRMEKAGLIERYPDSDDQRLTRVRLTESGHQHAKEHAKAHISHINSGLSSLTEPERKELARLLSLVGDNIEKGLDR